MLGLVQTLMEDGKRSLGLRMGRSPRTRLALRTADDPYQWANIVCHYCRTESILNLALNPGPGKRDSACIKAMIHRFAAFRAVQELRRLGR